MLGTFITLPGGDAIVSSVTHYSGALFSDLAVIVYILAGVAFGLFALAYVTKKLRKRR